jgi:hypothetical protein
VLGGIVSDVMSAPSGSPYSLEGSGAQFGEGRNSVRLGTGDDGSSLGGFGFAVQVADVEGPLAGFSDGAANPAALFYRYLDGVNGGAGGGGGNGSSAPKTSKLELSFGQNLSESELKSAIKDALLTEARQRERNSYRVLSDAAVAPLDVTPTTPLEVPASITIELPQPVFSVMRGVGDVAMNGAAALADLTVAPAADVVQAGLKALHGAITGDFRPLTPLSSYGDAVVNRGEGTWATVKATATNVFHVSPLGMVYGAGRGGFDATTAIRNGDIRGATSAGLGLGLTFAGAKAVGLGNYGFTVSDVNAVGFGAAERGAIGVRFGRLGNVGNAGLEGVPINGATRTVPLGFNPPEQFTTAAQQLQDALVRSGVTDATVGVRGSSVTGVSLTKGTPFGPQSDIDFFIESRQLTEGYKTSKNIPGFVHPGKILPDYPLLQDWSTTWTNTLGRDVTPGAFVPGTLPSQPSIVVRPIGPVTPTTGG